MTSASRPPRDVYSWGLRSEQGPGRLYRGLRRVVKAAMKGFYRTVEVTGRENVPADRPTILASNHPNSIVDPLLLGIFEQRQVAFCARDGLFDIPGFGALLRAVGAIPIYRRKDHSDNQVDNRRAFAACREVLENKGVISIFPEGRTHADMKVHQVKTGTARIALDAEKANDHQLGVRIVPVGLNYLVRQAFRSDVHIAFGEPIAVSEFSQLARSDERAAVRALTQRIEAAMRQLALHVEESEDERVIAQITSIVVDIRAQQGLDRHGQTPAERTALVRRIVDAYRWYQEVEPDRTAQLRRRLQRYVEERAELGLGGDSGALQHRTENLKRGTTWRRRRRFLLLGAPLAAWGIANSAAPYLAMRGLLGVMRVRKDRQALTKLIAGSMIYGGFWGAQTSAVAMSAGPVAGTLYGMSLPLSSVFALRYMTEARLHRLTLSGMRALWEHGERLESLKEERDALQSELSELRDRYLAHVEETTGVVQPGG